MPERNAILLWQARRATHAAARCAALMRAAIRHSQGGKYDYAPAEAIGMKFGGPRPSVGNCFGLAKGARGSSVADRTVR